MTGKPKLVVWRAHWSEKWPEPAINKLCWSEPKLADAASQAPWPLLA